MKNFNLSATIGLAACLLAVPALSAATKIVNMQGCLAQGARAHEYTATDDSGKTFGLYPDYRAGIDMKKHVGERVMITGTVMNDKRDRREATNSGIPVDDEYLQVYQIKQVSPSCQ